MKSSTRIVTCIPNFSEGRDPNKINQIVAPFSRSAGVKLLSVQSDADHHRTVVSVAGDPESLKPAVIESVGLAVDLIDMRQHRGQHPRMGAVDVVPFVPVKNVDMAEAIQLSKDVARSVADKYGLPVFLYEASASAPHRQNLAKVREGQFEQMPEKLENPKWKPDFGPSTIHPTAGITAIGARMPLVAFNVNLSTDKKEIADTIAKQVRHLSGGLRFCKGIGVTLTDRNIVQVSMNMTDYTKTALYRVFELIKTEARRWGVTVVGSEIVGLVPLEAIIDAAAYYLRLENFSSDQILEIRLME